MHKVYTITLFIICFGMAMACSTRASEPQAGLEGDQQNMGAVRASTSVRQHRQDNDVPKINLDALKTLTRYQSKALVNLQIVKEVSSEVLCFLHTL